MQAFKNYLVPGRKPKSPASRTPPLPGTPETVTPPSPISPASSDSSSESNADLSSVSERQANRSLDSARHGPSTLVSGASTPGNVTPGGNRRPPISSRSSVMYPEGDFRNSDDLLEIKCDVMINWLRHQQMEQLWSVEGAHDEGIILKKQRRSYKACPTNLTENHDGLYDSVMGLNVRVAMTINTRVNQVLLNKTTADYLPLPNGLRLQILPTISALPRCQKHHFAAFIRDTGLLVVWDDDPRHLLDRAKEIEKEMMTLIWDIDTEIDEKYAKGPSVGVVPVSDDVSQSEISDEEAQIAAPRKLAIQQSVLCALTMILLISAIASGWRGVALEISSDHNYIRLLFILAVPAEAWLGLFFFQSIIGCLFQLFGPVGQLRENSKFYSGVRSPRLATRDLPHVTIQCPVYKEGLRGVIEPTVMSVKAAISTYEMQGGTANIFINDDGMQLISPEDAQARRDFYDEHNIGWVARPKHNPRPADGEKGFIRPGKFKKASNMNYAMAVSARVEDKLREFDRYPGWSASDEIVAYDACLGQVIEEDQGRTWAEGNIRIGDYILIIDSDTRVPRDCFLDAVSEMEQSPQVAIIQFKSGVMNVTTSFFEKGITFFTNLVYTAISFAVACGDVAPFVGHNAILRWSAIQDIAYYEDDTEKYWSEKTVSEDFDMALRLQAAGYIIRFASYFDDKFEEGVSLTVYDELSRWEKYAYGCNELMFHPIKYWLVRGPFTKLFRTFICSNMPIASKMTILAYIGSYYAIGSAWFTTIINYFVVGWMTGYLDLYYVDSFKIFLSIVVVFIATANVSLAVLRYRTGSKGLLSSLFENFMWVPLMCIFMGGLSLHVSEAILSHMFGRDMQWGSTSKEAEDVSFFEELPKLVKKFKGTFAYGFSMIALIIVFYVAVPFYWQINLFVAVFPLAELTACHLLLPIVLNPALMLFTF